MKNILEFNPQTARDDEIFTSTGKPLLAMARLIVPGNIIKVLIKGKVTDCELFQCEEGSYVVLDEERYKVVFHVTLGISVQLDNINYRVLLQPKLFYWASKSGAIIKILAYSKSEAMEKIRTEHPEAIVKEVTNAEKN